MWRTACWKEVLRFMVFMRVYTDITATWDMTSCKMVDMNLPNNTASLVRIPKRKFWSNFNVFLGHSFCWKAEMEQRHNDVTVVIANTLKTLRSSRKHRTRLAQVVKKFSICCGKPKDDKIILSTRTNDGTLKQVTLSSYKTITPPFFYNILILSSHLIPLSQMLPSPQVFPIKILYAFTLPVRSAISVAHSILLYFDSLMVFG